MDKKRSILRDIFHVSIILTLIVVLAFSIHTLETESNKKEIALGDYKVIKSIKISLENHTVIGKNKLGEFREITFPYIEQKTLRSEDVFYDAIKNLNKKYRFKKKEEENNERFFKFVLLKKHSEFILEKIIQSSKEEISRKNAKKILEAFTVVTNRSTYYKEKIEIEIIRKNLSTPKNNKKFSFRKKTLKENNHG